MNDRLHGGAVAMGEIIPMNEEVMVAVAEAEEAPTKGCNYDLYNSIDKLLPLFALPAIPLFNEDGKPSMVEGEVDGVQMMVQETMPIDLLPRDFLVMRCIALHENLKILRLIEEGKLPADHPATILAWTWVSEDTIAAECGLSRSTVARTMESCGPAKLAAVSPHRKVGTEQRSVGQGFIDTKFRGYGSNNNKLSYYRRINRDFLQMMEAYLPTHLKVMAEKRSSEDLDNIAKMKRQIRALFEQEGLEKLLEERRAERAA